MFPLFVAAFSTKDFTQKVEVTQIMRTIETYSHENSTESVRRLLEATIEKQRIAFIETGTFDSVGWVEEMEKSGFIIHGL